LSYWHFDLYKGLWKYAGIKDLGDIFKASLAGTLFFAVYVFVILKEVGFSRSVLVIDFSYNILFFGGIRMLVRMYREYKSGRNNEDNADYKKVLIVGAGDAGEMILREMMKNPRLGYCPIGFVDDDRNKRKNTIHGFTVYGNTRDIPALVKEHAIHEVVIALPSARGRSIRRIVNTCKRADVRFKTLPFVSDLIDGNVSVSQIRDVAIEDLLGREAANLDMALIGNELAGKVIMITGAAGSIGSELVRQSANFKPKKIILFERGENDLYHLELELNKDSWDTVFIPYIGDIRDNDSLKICMEKHRPSYIFHAAAYKHVPMMEVNPVEAVKNNVVGTRNLVDMAAEFGVEKFVLISTDKAVRPTNVMGATKRIAELVVQEKNASDSCDTHFVSVRFGNVLGSNGSVIPRFKEQIAEGGPVTVTHPEVTRYFMTIPEAAQLVMQAGAMGAGGELFLLEMGETIKIRDLAENVIRLSGMIPGKDIEIVYSGLRPGEKLYEELLTEGEGIKETHHDKIKILESGKIDFDALCSNIGRLEAACKTGDTEKIKTILKDLVPEYRPMSSNVIASREMDLSNGAERQMTIH
jgi:FlaA1/EpsC-like NDP-sugar epimerase